MSISLGLRNRLGERPGAPCARTGETASLVDRLPSCQPCAPTIENERVLAVFVEAIEEALTPLRDRVRDRTAAEFGSDRMVDSVATALNTVRLRGGIERAANV